MSTVIPTGLTHLVPSNGTLVPISYTDITSATGTVGPLTLLVANPGTSSALFSYSAELNPVPPAPIFYTNVLVGTIAGQRYCYADITVVPGISVTASNITGSTTNWAPALGNAEQILGQDIGGNIGENVSMIDTEVDNEGRVTVLSYYAGVIPGTQPGPTATAPTLGSPTKVFTISPLTTQLIQIPSSSASLSTGPIDLVASGGNLYVTPVTVI